MRPPSASIPRGARQTGDPHGGAWTTRIPSRRVLFGACAAALGLSLGEAAARLNVTYNHLALVLDGRRTGSHALEGGTAALIAAGWPLLVASASLHAASGPEGRPHGGH